MRKRTFLAEEPGWGLRGRAEQLGWEIENFPTDTLSFYRASYSSWNWFCLRGDQRGQWHPTPVLLPGKSHGRRSLVDCSPWGREESDIEQLHFHFSPLCIGEGNGHPLQCSCLENPRDGVAQSRTRLKWLSSSSSKRWSVLQVGKDGPSTLCVWWRGGGRQPLAKHRLEEGAGFHGGLGCHRPDSGTRASS